MFKPEVKCTCLCIVQDRVARLGDGCNSRRRGRICPCLFWADNVILVERGQIYSNKDVKKKKRRHQKKTPETQLPAVASTTTSMCLDIWVHTDQSYCNVLVCVNVCWVISSSVPKLQPHPQTSWQIMPHDRERTWGWPYHATCPCDQLKRQQETAKGLSERYSSIALYPLNLGYWFKYETCTPQEEWQTSTSLSFFFIFFPPFAQI